MNRAPIDILSKSN